MIIGSRIHSEVCRLLIGGWASPYDKPHTYQRTAWATQHLKDLPVITSVTPTPITPEQLTAYLHRSPHWMPSRQRRDGAIIWAWHDRAQAPITVLVPETKQYQDDHELTIEALHKIAKAEGQHPDNLHAHITN